VPQPGRTGRIAATAEPTGETFWEVVALGALCHDAGKIPGGFQDMLAGRTAGRGQRHEVLSLGFLPWLIDDPDLLVWVATAVVTHHRPLTDDAKRSIQQLYGRDQAETMQRRFGPIEPEAVPALLAWLRATARRAGLPVSARPGAGAGPGTEGRRITDAETGGVIGPATVPDPAALTYSAHHALDLVLERWAARASPGTGLAAVLLQGAVTTADRLSSTHQSLRGHQPVGQGFRELLERDFAARGAVLRDAQRAAGDQSGHLLLRAPTGSGKTEAALLWAARQVQEIAASTGGTPRLYYTLPYLASINAMARRLGNLLGDHDVVGVGHSRAASYHLATAITPEDGEGVTTAGSADRCDSPDRADAAARAVSRAAATRLFRETVRIGTPYQLLRAALAGTASSGVLLDSANSVFVLDELHAYDPRRLGYIVASAGLWEHLGGRVAVLSATLPAALAGVIRDSLREPVREISAPVTGLPPRHRISTRTHHLTDQATAREIRERLRRGEAVLVVANNVADALELYHELGPLAEEMHGCDMDSGDGAMLLHSRFRRGDRHHIEELIRARFGTGRPRRGGLLVATQVVEVSLDVDFDVLFTSAAPLEALLQRFGRANRVAARPPADVIVHEPAWTTRRDAGEEVFADGVYPAEPVAAGWEILRGEEGSLVSEAGATGWLDTVYATPWGERWRAEVEAERTRFQRDFLTFSYPFDDRSRLAQSFDELFDGTEAILSEDEEDYRAALHEAKGSAGRLLADDLLIPLPYWSAKLARYHKGLQVRVVDGDYEPRLGLLAVRAGQTAETYRPGEVL
jgi:CRISPR-associated helicase Cas3/CRISPR-associated endonuclease Cas3-HD